MDWKPLIDAALSDIIQLLVMLLLGAGGTLVAYWQPRLKARYEKTVSLQDRQLVEMIVRAGVQAAEQLWQQPQVQELFVNKKALAESMIRSQLEEGGLNGTADVVNTLIESAVQQLFPHERGEGAKELPAAVPSGITISPQTAQALRDAVQSLADMVQKVPVV